MTDREIVIHTASLQYGDIPKVSLEEMLAALARIILEREAK